MSFRTGALVAPLHEVVCSAPERFHVSVPARRRTQLLSVATLDRVLGYRERAKVVAREVAHATPHVRVRSHRSALSLGGPRSSFGVRRRSRGAMPAQGERAMPLRRHVGALFREEVTNV